MTKYKMYRQKISFEDYLKTWKPEDVVKATEKDKLDAYAKYVFKVEVFNRDNFICQHIGENGECPYCKNIQFHPRLTAHHVKHQRNIKSKYTDEVLRKKLHSVRNGVTICESSHQAFNRYKIGLTFIGEQLPPHIRGHTFRLHKPEKVNMKELAIEGKKVRKQFKGEKYILTMKDMPLVLLLFRFLYTPYYKFKN